jgi:hypothetical protein
MNIFIIRLRRSIKHCLRIVLCWYRSLECVNSLKLNSNFQVQSQILNHPLKPFGHVKMQSHNTRAIFHHLKAHYLFGMFASKIQTCVLALPCPHIHPHVTGQTSLNGLSWNFILGSSQKYIDMIQICLKSDNSNRHCLYTYVHFCAHLVCH